MGADLIFPTHVGSVPRSGAFSDLIFAQEREGDLDAARFHRAMGEAMDACVAKQMAEGVTIQTERQRRAA